MEKKLKWGEAKKQVLSLWPEIKAELEKGATVRDLYNSLAEAGKIDMSERGFQNAIKKHLRSHSPAPAGAGHGGAKVAPPVTPPVKAGVSLLEQSKFNQHAKTRLTPQEAIQPARNRPS